MLGDLRVWSTFGVCQSKMEKWRMRERKDRSVGVVGKMDRLEYWVMQEE